MIYPFFSIIIPTYNRPEHLNNCLFTISNLDYPVERFEVIIIDDGGTSDLNIIISKFKDVFNLTYVYQTHRGPSFSRNNGRQHSKGDYLVFTDDDCSPNTDWLTIFSQYFSKNPNTALTGRTINGLSDNIYSTATQTIIDFLYKSFNFNPKSAAFATTSNLALSVKQFDEISGFDEEFPNAGGEDRDIIDRLIFHNFKMIYCDKAIVFHFHRLTLLRFWIQHYNYGKAAYLFAKKKAQRRAIDPLKKTTNIKLEPPMFYIQLLIYALRQSFIIFLLAVSSQVCTALGYFMERSRHDRIN